MALKYRRAMSSAASPRDMNFSVTCNTGSEHARERRRFMFHEVLTCYILSERIGPNEILEYRHGISIAKRVVSAGRRAGGGALTLTDYRSLA